MLPLKLINCALDLTIYGVPTRFLLPFGPRKSPRDEVRELKQRIAADHSFARIA